jgi:putative PIN family toxin of toxin-antitoxin system
MRAVLDTVIFVRALINPKGRWGRLLFEHSDQYVIVLSPEIVREVLDVIHRPELRRRFPEMAEPARIDLVLARLDEAEVVAPQERVAVCRDPNDDKFFECALQGAADYIVSEDKDVLAIQEHRGTRTVSAAAFLSVILPSEE